MSKKSGGQKYRERRDRQRAEHIRIVAESVAAYRAAILNGWEQQGAEYRRIIAEAARGQNDLTLTYRKDLKRPPSRLSVDDLAVVLLAVDGYGTRGLSAKRINLALGYCRVGKSLAKVAPILRALNSLGLIEYICKYVKGLLALGRQPKGGDLINDFPNLPQPPIKPALPMPIPKPKRRRVVTDVPPIVPQDDDNPF